jgi:hypothetical protein
MSADEILRAFVRGRGRWAGCDWPTRFGTTGLNLCTLTAAQAQLMARATAGDEAADWRAAVCWLREVEADARKAEKEAGRAVCLAADGRLADAVEPARAAMMLEEGYRPAVVWRPLHDAILAVLTMQSRPRPDATAKRVAGVG